MDSRPATTELSNKRPRSPTTDQQPQTKVPKTHSNHLQINYLARQCPENLPLVSADDSMPSIIHLIGEYDGVLHRHESIAGNLGACPLGPILIKRFERLFDGPPQVVKQHGKDGPTVTWLDVVEFAKNKPEQFKLEKSRNGVSICQFVTKQCRVEISEEDFVLIASGMPQKMIPPQPIIEDEEKELGALEILEKNLQQITQMADQAAARARQLSYRLKNRRTAIQSRRQNDATLQSRTGESWREFNGHSSHASPSGFVAVNNARAEAETEDNSLSAQFPFSHSNTDNVTMINGTSIKGASPTTRAELMKKFFTTADRQARGYDDASAPINPLPRTRPQASESPADFNVYTNASSPAVPIPSTPSSLLPPPKTTPQDKDDGGPYKLEMVARMEEMTRGERITPPCDRCRRLHMDCLKNLTACVGCTKKHAKCSWRDVKEEEIRNAWAPAPASRDRIMEETHRTYNLLPQRPSPAPRTSAERPTGPYDTAYAHHNRRESAPSVPQITPASAAPIKLPSSENSPRRAVSETENSSRPHHGHPRHTEEEDPDAQQRLMQAIMDTVGHHARVAAAVEEKERGVERYPDRGDGPHDRDMDRERGDRDRDHDRDRERRILQT
ncbi:uncharacterized protein N7484_002433 [Penicillium longicatenatum]|uniref:uncharacterized protein n=1 Tax=Penicillium longicatenatum TaxID=1561947 RepID=UPI00254877EB|nr:uncharacterized protein N7484_002433 [Penicillium longicatenatum]KAJ5658784.1 hypothetical protein N7484_002433 [Penicillium longicatenatum]KAJ5664506.1 hypothetical protein N7507_005237 [Penicillium longicatenatum]